MNERFSVRFNELEYKNLDSMTKIMCMDRHKVIKFALDKLNKELIKKRNLPDSLKKKIERRNALKEIKDFNHQVYTLRNCIKTIFNMGQTDYYTKGNVDYKIILRTIDNYLKLFDTFSDDMKLVLKDSIQTLQKLKNKSELDKMFSRLKYLDFKK